MAVKRVSKEALIGVEILFVNSDKENEVESISPSFAYNLIDIISLDGTDGSPVTPTSGNYKVYAKTDKDGGFKLISVSSTLNANLTGGSGLVDGAAIGLSFIGFALEIKIVPSNVDVAVAYRVLIKQSSNQLNANDSIGHAEVVNFPLTGAGEFSTAENTPLTQINAQYGLGLNVFTVTDANSSGNNTSSDGKFICQTGTAADGLASISTLRELTLRIGQGAIGRVKAAFTVGTANTLQGAGLFNAENALAFGFLGVDFGILYAHDGMVEHRELTITTPAAGTENATITVNGTGFTVPLTSTAGGVQHNAIEIADSLNAQVANYRFTANNDQVVALARLPGPSGSFAFTSATAEAAWIQISAGVDITIELIKQEDWNIYDVSDIALDTTKLNAYQVKYTTIGAIFSLVVSGRIRAVHFISAVNISNLSFVTSTSFRLGWIAQNLGNTSNITVEGDAAAGFVEGKKRFDSGVIAEDATGLSIGTTNETVFILRNRISFGERINRAELLPRFISAATDTNKVAFFELLLNPTFSDDVVFDYVDKVNSIAEVSEDNVGISGGTLIGSLTATLGGPATERFNDQENTDTFLAPGSVLAIVARVSSGAAAEMDTSISWQEDI